MANKVGSTLIELLIYTALSSVVIGVMTPLLGGILTSTTELAQRISRRSALESALVALCAELQATHPKNLICMTDNLIALHEENKKVDVGWFRIGQSLYRKEGVIDRKTGSWLRGRKSLIATGVTNMHCRQLLLNGCKGVAIKCENEGGKAVARTIFFRCGGS